VCARAAYELIMRQVPLRHAHTHILISDLPFPDMHTPYVSSLSTLNDSDQYTTGSATDFNSWLALHCTLQQVLADSESEDTNRLRWVDGTRPNFVMVFGKRRKLSQKAS